MNGSVLIVKSISRGLLSSFWNAVLLRFVNSVTVETTESSLDNAKAISVNSSCWSFKSLIDLDSSIEFS